MADFNTKSNQRAPAKAGPPNEAPKRGLSPSLDKILNEDRIGLAKELRNKRNNFKVYAAVEFDQDGATKAKE